MRLTSRVLLAICLGCSTAFSQSFNVDIGANQTYGLPSANYGAGALQPGTWSAWSGTQPTTLTSIDGVATAVIARYLVNLGSFSDVESSIPGATGDDALFMNDRRNSNTVFGAIEDVEISGLWNGNYEVYTYAFDSSIYRTFVRVFGSPDPFVNLGSGTFPGGQVQNVTFAKHHVAVTNGVITIEIDTATNQFSTITGFQLRWITPAPVNYCSPKVNSLGCTPLLTTSGAPSATAGSGFDVSCSNVRNAKVGLLLHGTNGRASGPFQGGTLCIAAPTHRALGINSGGTPLPAADCSGLWQIDFNSFVTGALGGAPSPALSVPGTTIDAQWWGRDPGFAPPNNSALSAGVEFVQGY